MIQLRILNSMMITAVCLWSGLSHANGVLVPAPIDKVFVPTGFDDNDKIEVVLHGTFVNSCYKMGPATATLNSATKKIVINAEAYFYSGAACQQMTVSFIKTVEIRGAIAAGSYQVEIARRANVKPVTLSVARATRKEADDFLYAAVQSADIEETNGSDTLVLKGQHPLLFQGCIKFVEIKTHISPSNVLVVQPITRIENNSAACTGEVSNRFEYKTQLKSLKRGQYVIHVRALDGNSINQLLEIN